MIINTFVLIKKKKQKFFLKDSTIWLTGLPVRYMMDIFHKLIYM